MTIFWLVLKILLIVLLVILAIVLLTLFIPVSLEIQYSEGSVQAFLRALCLKLRVYPTIGRKKETKKRTPKTKKKKAAKSEQKETSSKTKTHKKLTPQKMENILTTAGVAMQKLFGGLHFRHIRVFWPVGTEDAAETAILYGSTYGAVSSLLAVANNLLDLQFDEFRLEPDFNGELRGKQHFSCQITTHLLIIVVAGIYAFFRLRQEKIL